MKSTFLIVAFLCCLNSSFAQKKAALECGFFGKKAIAERSAIFPFNKAKKVVLVAFPPPNGIIIIEENGNQVLYDSINFPNTKEVICLPTTYRNDKYLIVEKVTLAEDQINKLSNLMLNYKIKKISKKITISPGGCYEPRNAILFLDENNVIISYVEICFQCIQFYQYPKETIPDFNILSIVEECRGMIGLFKDFFKNNGIHYGVERE